ncbi:RNase H domain-containing protein [Trichonephila clavipes]|nr:RNase H domain-containing protein [Trichonephila clavipes]
MTNNKAASKTPESNYPHGQTYQFLLTAFISSLIGNTYVSLIRPILEYGFPIFCCSSDSSLQNLERVPLSVARIITGLRNSCPKDIVLCEADLQPLSLRRNASLVKYYYGKLSGLGFQNRTSKFLRSWSSHQKLKRGSPFGHFVSGHLVASSIEHHS